MDFISLFNTHVAEQKSNPPSIARCLHSQIIYISPSRKRGSNISTFPKSLNGIVTRVGLKS